MRLGLIQSKQNELYDFSNPDLLINKNRVIELQNEMQNRVLKDMKEAGQKGCDFIVTTEAVNFCGTPKNICCDYTEVVPSLSDLFFSEAASIAKEYKTYIALGAYNRRNGKMYNSVIVYNRKGELLFIYDKVHLAGSEKENLTPGNDYPVIDTEFGKIGVAVCWDMQFPEVSRELVLAGAELIVCPTWGWEQIYGHARAYENGIYVASAMSVPFGGDITGIRSPSEVIAPTGEILASASRNHAEVIICDIDIGDCREYRNLRISDRHPETYRLINKIDNSVTGYLT
ncbi:MAG: carbon-nitrogen hydrolase family protein [Anaerocolumna sp.]